MKDRMRKSVWFFIALLFVPGVLAFGVSYDSFTLRMAPGETIEMNVNLQNMIGNSAAVVAVSIVEGGEIATILGKTRYTLPAKTEENFKIRISVPSSASVGTSYNLKIRVDGLPNGGEDIEVTTGQTVERNIVVVSESLNPSSVNLPSETPQEEFEMPAKNPTMYGFIAVVIVAMIALVVILMKKKRKRR